ncbi:MAG: hypothetical protein GY906_20005 [bacterium]|nr:hypothetical protein [bacterium]
MRVNTARVLMILIVSHLGLCASGWAQDEKSATGLLRDFYDKGFKFTSTDQRFSLRINGAVQLRYTFMDYDETIVGNESNYSNFYMRRARLYFRGHTLDPRLTYFIHLQLEPSRSVNSHDLWVEYTFTDWLRLGAGRMKIAYGLEFLNSGLGLSFVDRSVFSGETDIDRNTGDGPVYPGGGTERFALTWVADTGYATGGMNLYRSQGIQLRGHRGSPTSPTFEYQLGLWNGRSTLGFSNTSDDHLLAARVGYHPWGWIDWILQGDGDPSPSFQLSFIASAYTSSSNEKGLSEGGYNLAFMSCYRGFSADFEWGIESFNFDKYEKDFDRTGWRLQLGYFVVPQTLEVVARHAEIERINNPTYERSIDSGLGVVQLSADSMPAIGLEKRISEISIGAAWYVHTWHRNKLQIDFSRLVREFAADPNAVIDGVPTPISKAPNQEDYRIRLLAQVVF